MVAYQLTAIKNLALATNLIEADLQRKTNCYNSETNRPSADSNTILCEWWLTASCRRYNWSRQVHRFTCSPQSRRHIGSNHSAYSREIALWDTNCRLARQYKWFLHHVLTVNQRLTNLPSNRALNNVLNSSD